MSARQCKACDGPVRRTTGRRATVLFQDGRTEDGNICRKCQIRARLLVTAAPVTIAPACAYCKRAPGKVCEGCAERLATHAADLTHANVALRQSAAARGHK